MLLCVLLFVYVCLGCLSVVQVVNCLVVDLDCVGRVEMFCISGVGGGVCVFVKIVCSGWFIFVFDGCVLVCVKVCLVMVGVVLDIYFVFNQCGVKKCYYVDCSDDELSVVVVLVDDVVNMFQYCFDIVGD